jgi:hypothetical protein
VNRCIVAASGKKVAAEKGNDRGFYHRLPLCATGRAGNSNTGLTAARLSGQYAARKAEHRKSSIRVKVEHVFGVVEGLFGYQGFAKTAGQIKYPVCAGKFDSG